MKMFSENLHCREKALMILLISGVVLCRVHSEGTNSPGKTTPSASEAVADDSSKSVPIPQSLFIIPATPKEGRDPFFPNLPVGYSGSFVSTQVKTNTEGINELILQGISGQAGSRLCVINKRTFAVGEENDVPTISGSIRVRCLEINETNIVIELGGVRQPLSFKPLK